ncbi:MAG: hypothetical protein PHH31_09235 [Acidaminococcaceae bacterium]|nr:hypothetical protein [Acidaminococcaceae bacterium]
MKLKGIELNGTYKVVYYATCFEIYDEKDNIIYYENNNGYWSKSEYDEKGNTIYYESGNGYWSKSEYNEKGNVNYYENSDGIIIDERVAEQEGADFYGVEKYSEKADDILFALQVMYGQPKYTYREFQIMDLSQTEINEALEYVEKKGYNKFTFFEKY